MLLKPAGKRGFALRPHLHIWRHGLRGHPPLIPARHAGRIVGWGGEGGLRGALEALPFRLDGEPPAAEEDAQ